MRGFEDWWRGKRKRKKIVTKVAPFPSAQTLVAPEHLVYFESAQSDFQAFLFPEKEAPKIWSS